MNFFQRMFYKIMGKEQVVEEIKQEEKRITNLDKAIATLMSDFYDAHGDWDTQFDKILSKADREYNVDTSLDEYKAIVRGIIVEEIEKGSIDISYEFSAEGINNYGNTLEDLEKGIIDYKFSAEGINDYGNKFNSWINDHVRFIKEKKQEETETITTNKEEKIDIAAAYSEEIGEKIMKTKQHLLKKYEEENADIMSADIDHFDFGFVDVYPFPCSIEEITKNIYQDGLSEKDFVKAVDKELEKLINNGTIKYDELIEKVEEGEEKYECEKMFRFYLLKEYNLEKEKQIVHPVEVKVAKENMVFRRNQDDNDDDLDDNDDLEYSENSKHNRFYSPEPSM